MANEEYQGISFPFRISGRGGIATSGRTNTEQQHIRECLSVLLGTMEFERVMRPYNGLEELDIFFNDLNESTKNMAIFKINEKVQEFEPRIVIRDINIVSQTQQDGSIKHIVALAYTEADRESLTTLTLSF